MNALFLFSDSLAAIVLIALACGYFAGSIPFGVILTQRVIGRDIRALGSGGTGATNVLRYTNKTTALVTLILDTAKGSVPCAVFLQTSPAIIANDLALIAGLSAVIGHMYPVWTNFQGGKGVATALGVLLVIQIELLLLGLGLWLMVAALSRFSSAASLIMILSIPAMAIALSLDFSHIFVFILLSILVIVRHKDNILRLLNQQESTIGFLHVETATASAAVPPMREPIDERDVQPDPDLEDFPQTRTEAAQEAIDDNPHEQVTMPIVDPEPLRSTPEEPVAESMPPPHSNRRGYIRPQPSSPDDD